MHRACRHLLAAGFFGVERRLVLRGPAENRHQLFIRRAVLGGDCGTSLALLICRAMRQAGGIAPIPHLVA